MSGGPWSGVSSSGLPGVREAARAHGLVRNRRDPSARPSSGKDRSYKPMVKSGGGQRESDGVVVPLIGVQHNAPGGKGPDFDHAGEEGKREGMAGTARSNHPGGPSACRSRTSGWPSPVKVRELQRKLWAAAKQSAGRRFHALYDRIHRGDVLWEAWERVRANRGAAGVDRVTLAAVEDYGVERMLVSCVVTFGRYLPSGAGAAGGDPETRWWQAAVGYSDGARPGGPAGGQARAGTDLRGRLPAVLVWVPAEAVGDAGDGADPGRVHRGSRVRGRGRHRELLRRDRPRPVAWLVGRRVSDRRVLKLVRHVAAGGGDGRRGGVSGRSRGRRRAG